MKYLKIKSLDSTDRSALINMALKPISVLLSLAYIPMLLNYLGDEKYGLWATILSIITWINFFDVGIGNGLRNLLSKTIAQGIKEESKKAVSTAFVMLSLIACLLLIILTFVALLVDWSIVFNTSIEMRTIMIITFLFVCINFVLALSNTLLYALNQAEKVSVRSCFIQLANIIGLFIISKIYHENMVAIAVLFGGTSTLFYLGNAYNIFKNNTFLIPSIKLFDSTKIKEICSLGIQFFVIQLMGLLLFTVDNILITHYFGATVATPFSITNKVFNTIYSVFAAFVIPYWSRTTAAYSQKNYSWIHKSIKKVFFVALLFIVIYIMMGFIFKPIVRLWLGRELFFQPGLVTIMIVFFSIYTLLGAECQFINGIGKIRTQLVIYIIIGIANIPFSIFLGVHMKLNSVGIRLATTILVALAVIVLAFDLNKIIKDLDKMK